MTSEVAATALACLAKADRRSPSAHVSKGYGRSRSARRPGPRRPPTQRVAGLFARRAVVERREMGEPAEVLGRLLGSLARRPAGRGAGRSHRRCRGAARPLRRRRGSARRPPPFRSPARTAPRRRAGARRASVEPFADIGRDAFLARDSDQDGNEAGGEAVVAVAVDRWRQANRRHAHAARRQGERGLLGNARDRAVARRIRVLGHRLAGAPAARCRK